MSRLGTIAVDSSKPREVVEPVEQTGRELAHLNERRDSHENCKDLAKCERELILVGFVHPEFDAGHPVQKRDNDHRDEMNEREVFTHNRYNLPKVHTIRFTWRPDDATSEEDRDDPTQNNEEEG